MIDQRAWAIRPKWHLYESPRSYTRRQCHAAGIPLDFAERGLTSRSQPSIRRVWSDKGAAAAVVEAAAGRPAGHYERLKSLAQPDPALTYPERFLCRLCAAGERVEQIPHDRENWCLRHPGKMVWVGPGTTPDTQLIVRFRIEMAKAELKFRRIVAEGRINVRLHSRVWEMVRDAAWLIRSEGKAPVAGRFAIDPEIDGRAVLYIHTIAVLEALSDSANIERWRTQMPALLRDDIASTVPLTLSRTDTLIERIVLWLRPLRRECRPTRVDPLDVP